MENLVKKSQKSIGAVRKEVIAALKKIAKDNGGEVNLNDLDLFFVQSNTEDMIFSFDSKGKLGADNMEDATFKNLSTDFLILMLKEVSKKI